MDNESRNTLRSTYSFQLPESHIATAPVEPRDSSKLMVLHLSTKTIEHRTFSELPSLLPEGTRLVRNNSRVIPARVPLTFPSGGKGEAFFLERYTADTGLFFVRPGKKFSTGARLHIHTPTGDVSLTVEDVREDGARVLKWHLPEDVDILSYLEETGETPYPPYMGKLEDTQELRNRYQTTYAEKKGSVAAPTAGLHFTEQTFADLAKKNITPIDITLHVGAGTFLPVKTDDVREHTMHQEWFEVDHDAAARIQETWDAEQPLLAVGTTSLRVLEYAYREKLFEAKQAVTDTTSIFIYPPQQVHSATMLLTNFHLPESTLLMLVSAFAGDTDFILEAYRTAVEQNYRFYSFGDAMLLLP